MTTKDIKQLSNSLISVCYSEDANHEYTADTKTIKLIIDRMCYDFPEIDRKKIYQEVNKATFNRLGNI